MLAGSVRGGGDRARTSQWIYRLSPDEGYPGLRTFRFLSPAALVLVGIVEAVSGLATQNDRDRCIRIVLTVVSTLIGALSTTLSCFVAYGAVSGIPARSSSGDASPPLHANRAGSVVAFRRGAATGLFSVAVLILSMWGLLVSVTALGVTNDEIAVPLYLVGYGLGASLVAVCVHFGCDPSAGAGDESPGHAVVAYTAGLFASLAVLMNAATLLGAALSRVTSVRVFVWFPLVIAACGLLSAIIGIAVRGLDTRSLSMHRFFDDGLLVVTLANAALLLVVRIILLHARTQPDADGGVPRTDSHWTHVVLAGLVGLAAAVALLYLPRYFPVLLGRFAHVVVIVLALGGALYLGERAHVTGNILLDGVFGITIAVMGMSMCAAYVLSVKAMSVSIPSLDPLTDLSNRSTHAIDAGDALRRSSVTTDAYAEGVATFVVILLVCAFLDQVATFRGYTPGTDGWNASHRVDLATPQVYVGAVIGFIVISLAVSLVAGVVYTPRDFVLPGAAVVLVPILTGVVLRAGGAAAFLICAMMGATLRGARAVSPNGNRVAGGQQDRNMRAVENRLSVIHTIVRFMGALLLVLAPLFV